MSNKTIAIITTAVELTRKQMTVIAELLAGKLGKPIEVVTLLDESLLGGLFIEVDNLLIDVSVRNHLNELKESLIRGTVNE